MAQVEIPIEDQQTIINSFKGVLVYCLRSGQNARESDLLLMSLVRACDVILTKLEYKKGQR